MSETLYESDLDRETHGLMIVERHADNYLSITTGVSCPKGESYTSFTIHPDSEENINAVKSIIASLQNWLDHTEQSVSDL